MLGDRPPTAADVPNLRYTEWVVREAMRLYPPAWGIAREALADCEIGGYHVPKGTQIFMIQWLVHRDARWFDDPEVFRPERWDNDLIKRLPRCAYFPVRRRPADLHRQPLRHDGGRPDPGHDRPAATA